MVMSEVNFVQAGPLRLAVIGIMAWLAAGMLRRPGVYYPLSVILSGFLLGISLAGSLMAMRVSSNAGRRTCSSVTTVLRLSSRHVPLPDFIRDDKIYSRANRYKLLPGLTSDDDLYGRAYRYELAPSLKKAVETTSDERR